MKSTMQEGTLGLRAWRGTSGGMATAHRHFDLELNYVLHGAMTYLIAGAVVTLPPRRLCAIWGGIAHQTLMQSAPPEAFWVTAPLPAVLGWGLPEALMRHLFGEGLVIGDEEANDEQLLGRWADDLANPSSPDEVRRIVLLELEARLRRLALRFRAEGATTGGALDGGGLGSGLAAIGTLARYICDHYQDDVSMEQIAGAAHLHPNYAMTLFRRHTGMTLNGYLVLQRVAHAQRLLATTEQSIADIARESGFGSSSRFYDAFGQQTGSTPSGFRQRLARRPE